MSIVLHYMNIPQLVHSAVNGHLDYSLFGAVTEQYFYAHAWWLCPYANICSPLGWIPRSGMGLSKDLFKFSFSRFCQFPQRDVQSGLPQQQIVTPGAEHPVALVRSLLVSHYDFSWHFCSI